MDLLSIFNSLFNIFKWLLRNIIVVFKTNLFRKKKINFRDFDVIFFTAFEKPFEKRIPHPYNDLYFGQCPYKIEQSGKKALVIGRCSGEPMKVVPRLRKVNSPTVIAHHDLVNLRMIFVTFIKSFFQRINFSIESLDKKILLFFLRKDSLKWVLTMADCILYEDVVSKLFKKNENATVVHLYENNIWERSIDVVSRKISPKRKLLGYLHTSILPLHMKNIVSSEEISIRPAPDKIITTGKEAKRNFHFLNRYPEDKLIVGCNLREADFTKLKLKKGPPKNIKNILVLLEGLPTSFHFLKSDPC